MKRISLVATAAALALGAPAVGGPGAATRQAPVVTVHKSPTCGCCKAWVAHLREAGFTVQTHDMDDVSPVKDDQGVPGTLRSCHTALVGGYVFEGHVPADLVQTFLRERPAHAGLAVPGMPMGSPGMEGGRKDAYDVVAFDHNGATTVYAKR